ncbi:hypothetical protein MRX96_044387 [Rhipicephalus microplus]
MFAPSAARTRTCAPLPTPREAHPGHFWLVYRRLPRTQNEIPNVLKQCASAEENDRRHPRQLAPGRPGTRCEIKTSLAFAPRYRGYLTAPGYGLTADHRLIVISKRWHDVVILRHGNETSVALEPRRDVAASQRLRIIGLTAEQRHRAGVGFR